jgi:hypothetical protein
MHLLHIDLIGSNRIQKARFMSQSLLEPLQFREIDLVVQGEADAMLVECKWASKQVGSDILANLERKADLVQSELAGRQIHDGLCTRSGFTSPLLENVHLRQDVTLFDLAAIGG